MQCSWLFCWISVYYLLLQTLKQKSKVMWFSRMTKCTRVSCLRNVKLIYPISTLLAIYQLLLGITMFQTGKLKKLLHASKFRMPITSYLDEAFCCNTHLFVILFESQILPLPIHFRRWINTKKNYRTSRAQRLRHINLRWRIDSKD